jgi:D-alanyl-D-alanine dipeptidase
MAKEQSKPRETKNNANREVNRPERISNIKPHPPKDETRFDVSTGVGKEKLLPALHFKGIQVKPFLMTPRTHAALAMVLISTVLALASVRAESRKEASDPSPPPGFVDLSSSHPDIQVEMRYASKWNFMGHVVPGYRTNKCYLTDKAAWALHRVQARVAKKGYSLLLLDCYRPAQAVRAFVDWTRDERDQKMKSIFYPDEPKSTLIERGYIADHSGHSRGSTVDLTLIKKPATRSNKDTPLRYKESGRDCRDTRGIERTGQLNMGTTYDCFSDLANTDHPTTSSKAALHRKILRDAMESEGFQNYPKEWWHFTLKNEPHPAKEFDFPVE